MTGFSRSDEDAAAVEGLLRASVPSPRADFRDELEQRIAPQTTRAGGRGLRSALAGGAAAATLAAVLLASSLFGQGPLRPDEASSVRTTEDCHFASVLKRVEVPVAVERHGAPALRYRERLVERRIERCP